MLDEEVYDTIEPYHYVSWINAADVILRILGVFADLRFHVPRLVRRDGSDGRSISSQNNVKHKVTKNGRGLRP
jgi:hypothetical protein